MYRGNHILLQGYKNSPTLAHLVLAKELEKIPVEGGVKVYQYVDDILTGGNHREEIWTTHNNIITHLKGLGFGCSLVNHL